MTEPSIKTCITEAIKDAMRAQDKPRLMTLRLAMADIKRIEIDERIVVDDARTLLILDKMIKQRRDSLRQFSDAGRKDLADVEAAEIVVLQTFMPKPLDEAEISSLIQQAIIDSGAQGMPDMGKVMAILRPQVQGRADMALVSQQLKARLSS